MKIKCVDLYPEGKHDYENVAYRKINIIEKLNLELVLRVGTIVINGLIMSEDIF
jgi:hypothetical protein